jgi:cation transport regulator
MPYATNADLPERVRHALPAHAQDIYREAFNHAFESYAHDPRREEITHRVARAAVKKRFAKRGTVWMKRDSFAGAPLRKREHRNAVRLVIVDALRRARAWPDCGPATNLLR